MNRLILALALAPALFTTGAFAQTVSDDVSKQLWCGEALVVAFSNPPPGVPSEQLTQAQGFIDGGNKLIDDAGQKYLDAGKEIADHAVLLPDGFRFSPSATPGDWTNASLAEIRSLYARYTDQTGGTRVNLQGIIFDTNGGGRIPLDRYLAATFGLRDAVNSGKPLPEIAALARQQERSAHRPQTTSRECRRSAGSSRGPRRRPGGT